MNFLRFCIGCKGQEYSGIGSFDIAKDDNTILFSYYKNGVASIYTINPNGDRLQTLVTDNEGSTSYENPRYSMSNKKIVFIEHAKDEVEGYLCIADSDGRNKERLTSEKQIITEASFSIDDNEIYFCKANVYSKYSPIGIRNAHDFDIFSLNMKSRKIMKMSELKAYGLRCLTAIDSNHLLLRLDDGPNGGMFVFTKGIPDKLQPLVPANNPRKDPSYYSSPIFVQNHNTIFFTAPYQIYSMDLSDKMAKVTVNLIGDSNPHHIEVFNSMKKVLFSKEHQPDLYMVNMDGTELITIPINLE